MTDELEKQTLILSEILKWTKIGNIEKVKEIIKNEFQENNKILVYTLSDGRSSKDIETCLNKKVDKKTVRNWWRKWWKMGLMYESSNFKRRLLKSFNLEDFDIKIPEIIEKEVKKGSKNIVSKEIVGGSNDPSPRN